MLGFLLIVSAAHAQTRPQSDTYFIPSDVQPVGGGEAAKSTNYTLDDTIGEVNIGTGTSDAYDLGAGYRQTLETFLSLSCSPDPIDIGTITFSGQKTGSGTCIVITDAEAGYSLAWSITTGSGGTNTGHLISADEDTIAPFEPADEGVPEAWSVAVNDARWGGRLSSESTDTDAKWGVDDVSDAWLNVGPASYTIVTRTTRTDPAGSIEILEFRSEIGAQKVQPAGEYNATATFTATAL